MNPARSDSVPADVVKITTAGFGTQLTWEH